jgi:hypothetical protein
MSAGCPEVVAVPSSSGRSLVVPRCPFCHKEHTHGPASYGFRLSHCVDDAVQGTYLLVPLEPHGLAA